MSRCGVYRVCFDEIQASTTDYASDACICLRMDIHAIDEGRLCRVRMAELLWGELDLDGLIRGIAEFVEDRGDLVLDGDDGIPLGTVDEVK
jgi:hypothetical protein